MTTQTDLIVIASFTLSGITYQRSAIISDPATVAAVLASNSRNVQPFQATGAGTLPSNPGTPTVSGGSGSSGGTTAGTGAGLTAAQQAALSPTGDVSGATVGTLTLAQLAAEVSQIAGVALDPSGTGTAPTGATTIAAAGTYQVLCAAGSIVNGAYIQNPPANKSPLYVDTAGATGTSLAATSIAIQPGQTWRTVFKPTNAVTVYSTALIPFQAGTF